MAVTINDLRALLDECRHPGAFPRNQLRQIGDRLERMIEALDSAPDMPATRYDPFSPPVSFDRCWVGLPSKVGELPRVTRIRRVADIWVNQGVEVSEWVQAPIVGGRRG